ncbi:histone-lysine N-methyltransferase SETMAR-like [Rhopalosiphum padi]|uniref:histone-lysine N-methyltransferase SETMAR-like n=1 Tax=Rhopalosiphum padi TaxID=40932 RepID=UPI00298EA849|nr:histone-lysine N-methyltransferase SETMAR-like [Rhopalosiphum padi]
MIILIIHLYILQQTFQDLACTSCQNRIVQLGPRIGLRITHCNKGYGLYTDIAIERGQFVCEYAGEIIDLTEAQRRSNSDNENYIFVINEYFSGHVTTTVIDSTVIGNIGRYINHSCEPNCMIVPVRVDSLIPRLAIFAIKDLQCNEEITYHYGGEGSRPLNNLSDVKCLCESFSCNRFLPRKTGLF